MSPYLIFAVVTIIFIGIIGMIVIIATVRNICSAVYPLENANG
jgi:hypothetical protein